MPTSTRRSSTIDLHRHRWCLDLHPGDPRLSARASGPTRPRAPSWSTMYPGRGHHRPEADRPERRRSAPARGPVDAFCQRGICASRKWPTVRRRPTTCFGRDGRHHAAAVQLLCGRSPGRPSRRGGPAAPGPDGAFLGTLNRSVLRAPGRDLFTPTRPHGFRRSGRAAAGLPGHHRPRTCTVYPNAPTGPGYSAGVLGAGHSRHPVPGRVDAGRVRVQGQGAPGAGERGQGGGGARAAAQAMRRPGGAGDH